MRKQYDFTVIGTVATVTVLKTGEMPQQSKSTAVTGGSLQAWENGGMGFNICAGLSRLGMKVHPVLTYVDNRQKEYLYQFVRLHDWPLEGIMNPPPDSAGTTLMIQDENRNHMTLITEYGRRMPDSTYFSPQRMEDSFFVNSRMAILTVSMAMNMRPALEAVRRNQVPLCFSMRRDPVALPDDLLREIMGEAEIIFANEDETVYIREVLSTKSMDGIFQDRKLKLYIETLGGQGSRIYSRQKDGTILVTMAGVLPPSTKEIETIGAGDGYVSCVASFVIEREGSVTNLPTREQMIERYLQYGHKLADQEKGVGIKMDIIEKMKSGEKFLIGMVHCLPLPGTYLADIDIQQVAERAVSDAKALETAGYDALIIENEDLCCDVQMRKIQIAGLSMVMYAVREAVSLPLGLCCGSLNYEEGLSIALVGGGSFVRLPVFVDTVMNYNGILFPCSAKAIDYRRTIGAQQISILADIQVKHYYMVNPEVEISVSAEWAQRQGTDAVIVTGAGSGLETSMEDLEHVKNKVKIPVVVGSGINKENIREQLQVADGLIIGTCLRTNGKMSEPIDAVKAEEIIQAASCA